MSRYVDPNMSGDSSPGGSTPLLSGGSNNNNTTTKRNNPMYAGGDKDSATPTSSGLYSPDRFNRFGSASLDVSPSSPHHRSHANEGKDTPLDEFQRESSLIMGSAGVGGTEEASSLVIDLSNGLRIKFLSRKGWDNEVLKQASGSIKAQPKQHSTSSDEDPCGPKGTSATPQKDGDRQRKSGGEHKPLRGRRVTPFATLIFDYKLMKALDTKSEVYRRFIADGGHDGPSNGCGVGKESDYTSFNFAADTHLASRMAPGGVYEVQNDFSVQFVPSYKDVSAPSVYALNIAFPYLREGDEVLLFAPSYLGPCLNDTSLGESFRPSENRIRRNQKKGERKAADEDDEASDVGAAVCGDPNNDNNGGEFEEYFVPNPHHPAANTDFAEHSFIRLSLKRVMPEESLTTDRYITKTVIAEGHGKASDADPSVKLLDFEAEVEDDRGHLNHVAPTPPARKRRFVGLGSVVSFDIGEVNEYLNKPTHYRNVKDCVIAGSTSTPNGRNGGGSTCDELDVVLLSMHEGEFSSVKIGSTRYQIKLLEIAPGTAKGEVVGNAATDLARRIKDAGNDVLAVADSTVSKYFSPRSNTGIAPSTGPSNAFSSPLRPSGHSVTMGSPVGSLAADESGAGGGLSALTAEILAARRYFPPPSDLTPNPILDALSTFVVRPPRRSYLRCAKSSSSSAVSTSVSSPGAEPSTTSSSGAAASMRGVTTRNSEPFFLKIKEESNYRALQHYKYAEHILFDDDGIFYQDDQESDECRADDARGGGGASSSSSRTHKAQPPLQYSLASRRELLGTIHGNMSQVFTHLKFYDEAIHYATEALDRCAEKDRYKNLYRRAKACGARRATLGASSNSSSGAVDVYAQRAIVDLMAMKEIFKAQNVSSRDEKYVEVEKELAKYASITRH